MIPARKLEEGPVGCPSLRCLAIPRSHNNSRPRFNAQLAALPGRLVVIPAMGCLPARSKVFSNSTSFIEMHSSIQPGAT